MMSENEAHADAMNAIGFAAQILTPHAEAIGDLIKAERDMHSFLHITDPTMYRKASNSKSLALQVQMSKAALAFILEIQKVKAGIEALDEEPA